jgi:predicted negative regulator of RcsB-dependent stress response
VSQHISRKELKQDEFKETLTHGAEYALSHTRMLWIGGLAVLVALVLVGGWRLYSDRQSEKATAAFEDARKTYEARIRTIAEPEEPGEVTYLEEKNKFLDAQKKFRDVAAKYSLTPQGQAARYYAAICTARIGQTDEALKDLKAIEGGSNVNLASLARLEMAQLYAQTGKLDEAARLLKLLIDKPTDLVPKALAQMALADQYRKANPAEAAKLYQQIKKDHPDSMLGDEADKRLTDLGPQS